jgi:dehydrogenase/reductase SDR family protein 12
MNERCGPAGRLAWSLTFLPTHVPSFTALGYRLRRPFWRTDPRAYDGQRWLVTGASTGIGREIARAAAAGGAEVLAVARRADKLEALAVETASASGTVTPFVADLARVRETERLLAQLAAAPALDVLVNNVGVLLSETTHTDEGLETGFATNLLNPWLLTDTLLARGGIAPGGVVVNMSSGGMYGAALDVDALQRIPDGRGELAYANHKRAQVMLTAAWRRRVGGGVNVYVTHPGWVDTPGVETSLPNFHRLLRPLLRDVEAGADTALWLASRRPVQRQPEAIWFDRTPWPVHGVPLSRGGDDLARLQDYLEYCRQRATAGAAAA